MQVAADYLQGHQVASLPLFPGREDVAQHLRELVAKLKMLNTRKQS